MLKYIGTPALMILLLIGCGSKTLEQSYPEVALAQLMDSTNQFVGDTIRVAGTVDHVCKHGGKKMFLVGENPDHRIKVTAGTAIGSYSIDMEGSDVMVTAVLEEMRVDEAYLSNWEAELAEEVGAQQAGDEHAEDEHEYAKGEGPGEGDGMGKSPAQQQIDDLREQVCAAESGYLSFYSLAGLSYEVLP